MNLPDDLLISKIKRQSLYRDKKSREGQTNRIKAKYKLAGNEILSEYFFNILTKDPSTCKSICTLRIEKGDWENQIPGPYLREKQSYCDLSKFEIIERKELLQKIKDKDNGFPYIARLCDSKYEALLNLRDNVRLHERISEKAKGLIDRGLSNVVSAIASKLGLN